MDSKLARLEEMCRAVMDKLAFPEADAVRMAIMNAGYKVSIAADGTVTVQQAPRRGDERAQG